MGKTGKISVIPKEFPNNAQDTMDKSLHQRGLSRSPGTVLMRYPYKEANGKYRTGLDENAKKILELPDGDIKEAERNRIIALRKRLEHETGLDLNPRSSYYNHNSSDAYKVGPVALRDGDNDFNLTDAWQHITWLWVINLPDIASSLQAYRKGKYPHDTQFYVNDEDVEDEIKFERKSLINKAIIKFDTFSLDKRKKIARLLALPVGDSTKEQTVYNLVDDFLKKETITEGVHKNRNPVTVFNVYAGLPDEVLDVRDVINVAFIEQIYRKRENGRIYEGELEVFKDEDSLVMFMMDDRNQKDLLDLESKINAKKLQHV